MRQFLLLPALLLILSAGCQAAPPASQQSTSALPTAKVVSIVDGDTVWVLLAGERTKIRLWGIDTPEKKQAFGTKAQKALGDRIHEKEVGIRDYGKDRYGRVLAELVLGGENVNLWMVRNGWAWHYAQYSPKADYLRDAQTKAKAEKAGLWADKNPVAPWEFRKKK